MDVKTELVRFKYPKSLSMYDKQPHVSRHEWAQIIRLFNRGPTEVEARATSREFQKINAERVKSNLPKIPFATFTASVFE